MKPKPLTAFRAYCENKSLYYRVVVWKTLKDLRKANPGNRRTLGLCRSFRVITFAGPQPRFKPILGEIHLAKKFCTTGIIAHEAAHSMISWASEVDCIPVFDSAARREAVNTSRKGHLTQDDPEERCCFVLGNMVRQIVWQLYKRKILK